MFWTIPLPLPVCDVFYEWSLTEMADQNKKTTWRGYVAKGIPKYPKIVYDIAFITCMVSHFLISIGKAVPYVYTVVSMRYKFKHSLNENTLISLESCNGFGNRTKSC